MLGLYHHGLQCHQRIVRPDGATLVSRRKKFFAVVGGVKVSVCRVWPLLGFDVVPILIGYHLILSMASIASRARQGCRPERHGVAFPRVDNGGCFGQYVTYIESL